MRSLLFWFGLVVLAAAFGTLLWDAVRWAGAGSFAFSTLGEIWVRLDRDSLLLLEPALVRHIGPWTWEDAVFPLLQQPALLDLCLLGLFCMLLPRLFRRRRGRSA